jgi:hypothetical protein
MLNRAFNKVELMPYTKAHYYMLVLLPVTVAAFWPSYFGLLPNAPMIHHLHGMTGTLWILLIAAQSYSIQSRKLQLHRGLGKLIFALTPVMVGSFALVSWLGAQKAVGGHPFYVMFGQALLTSDVLLTFTTPLIVYLALRFRRNMRVHGALMISTVFGLLPPILSRLIVNFTPGLTIEGPDTMYRFGYGLHISIALTFVLAIYLFFRYRANGWPWMLGAVITALMYVLFATFGQTDAWATLVQHIAALTPVSVFVFGAILGLVACIAGWYQKK